VDGGEIAIFVADLVGFVGALLLAVPFFVGQGPRDSLLMAVARRAEAAKRAEAARRAGTAEPRTIDAFDTTAEKQLRHIARYSHWEARAAWGGALLIALAFIVRLAVPVVKYLNDP
jgi:hypothetical protein